MSEHKTPSEDDQQSTTDELFDREYLSDSDSEFLAELDRVLTSESDASSRPAETPESDQIKSDPDDAFALHSAEAQDELPGMLDEYEQGFDLADEENPLDPPSTPDEEFEKALKSSSEDALMQAELKSSIALDTPVDEPETSGTATAAYSDMDLGDSAEELDWNDTPDEVDANSAQQPPMEQPPTGEEQQEESPFMDEKSVEDNWIGNNEAMETFTVPAAAEPEKHVVQTAGAEADKPMEPVPAGNDKPTSSSSGGSVWTGIAALLGLLGVAAGGSGLWMANDMTSRLTQLQSAAVTQDASQEPVAPQVDTLPVSAEDNARISDLEQTTLRLENDLTALSSQLESGLAGQDQRMTDTLGDVQSSLSDLQQQLQDLNAEIAAKNQQLKQASAPPATMPAAVMVEPPPVESVEETIPAPVAIVVEEQTQSVPTSKTTSKPAARPKPKSSSSPGWSVNLQSFQNKGKAEQVRKRLNADGIPAEVSSTSSKGKTWYRVKVSGFPGFDQAKAYADEIRSKPGLSSAWIGRD